MDEFILKYSYIIEEALNLIKRAVSYICDLYKYDLVLIYFGLNVSHYGLQKINMNFPLKY
jgi:hypothetical protein